MIRVLNAGEVSLSEILARTEDKRDIAGTVSAILADVRQNGDAALRRYTKEFDKAEPDTLEVPQARMMGAMSPSQVGGETMTVSGHPAILAGMQSMRTVEQVFGKVGIDMIAGPSDILVIADGNSDARQVLGRDAVHEDGGGQGGGAAGNKHAHFFNWRHLLAQEDAGPVADDEPVLHLPPVEGADVIQA